MTRYALTIDFNGSRYCGWQKQLEDRTVQGEIEKTLSRIASQTVTVMGCGRTDTGVHGRNYVLHTDLPDGTLGKSKDWVYKLNAMLPRDIAIKSITEASPDFHARFLAKERGYCYRLRLDKQVFGSDLTAHYKYESALSVEKLNALSELFLAGKDFTCFSKLHGGNLTNLCNLTVCKWDQVSDKEFHFHIAADRFLRGMVRLIVGTHLNYHRGKITLSDVRLALTEMKPLPLVWSVEANGLCFESVSYDKITFT